MKYKAQSLIEFAIILTAVTAIAILALNIISIRINADKNDIDTIDSISDTDQPSEEENCTKVGLYWDKENGVCEAR